MQIPKRLEPPKGASVLEQAYSQTLLKKVEAMDKLKGKRKLMDTAEMREAQIQESILEWQVNSLMPYAVLCQSEAEREIVQARATHADFEQGISERKNAIGEGLGKFLGNPVAGADLFSLLFRMGGGFFDNTEPNERERLQNAVNTWGSIISGAKATIKEIREMQNKPVDSKKAQQINKQLLLESLNNNTEQKGE